VLIDPDCIFCKIVANEIPSIRVTEDENTIAFMDINPAADGHVLVIPRQHAANIFEISREDLSATAITAGKVANAVQSAFEPDGVSIIQANGKGAAQSVFHFHFHIIPRWIGDGLKVNWGPEPGDMSRIEQSAKRIRRAFETGN